MDKELQEHALGAHRAMRTSYVHCREALAFLQRLPDASVDLFLASPPYWGLRDCVGGRVPLDLLRPVAWGSLPTTPPPGLDTPTCCMPGYGAKICGVRRQKRTNGTFLCRSVYNTIEVCSEHAFDSCWREALPGGRNGGGHGATVQ